jgi:glycosyltransferase involved in cell wall biosynthesis
VTRALAHGLGDRGVDVTLLAGSRHDLGTLSDARAFYAGIHLHEVDFTPALGSSDPTAGRDGGGVAPLQPSYEDRPSAPDRVFAALDDAAYEQQIRAWSRALRAVDAARADVLHLHHLTPLNAAAARVAGEVPVVAHLHGTELLMLEAIAAGAPASWVHAERWAERLRKWAATCARLIVAPGNRARAATVLGLAPDRFVTLANGFDPLSFRPLTVDRREVWRRVLVDEPRGWRPGMAPGSVRYDERMVDVMARGPVIAYVGRFTEVKRLQLLLEAYSAARCRMATPASLVLVGGHPGEWEGEHPADVIDRLGLPDVMLAGWHDQSELPDLLAASDVLVLPSARESFGQVLVEAMACGVAPIAAASNGPATIIDHGETGWLFPVDDRAALTESLVHAINRPAERARRARLAEQAALDRFTWPAVCDRLESILRAAATSTRARQPGHTRHHAAASREIRMLRRPS